MKIAVLLEPNNFVRYGALDSLPDNFEIKTFGNQNIDENALIDFKPEMIIADSMLPVPGSLIEKLPSLKLIQSQGVGYNLFDLETAKNCGVNVCNCAGANATAVAEQAILLMLSVLRNVKENDRMVYAARQSEAKGNCFKNGITELRQCHIGIVGLGAIGKATADLCKAFGCQVSFYNRTVKEYPGCKALTLDELLENCDIISLHIAVTPETTHLINNQTLSKMKDGAVLINTARGEIVDQEALCEAIIKGKIAGAGLDTLSPEPVTADNPLLNLPEQYKSRVILSPHIGGITEGSFQRYFSIIWDNAKKVSEGKMPLNIVNK